MMLALGVRLCRVSGGVGQRCCVRGPRGWTWGARALGVVVAVASATVGALKLDSLATLCAGVVAMVSAVLPLATMAVALATCAWL